MYMRRLNKPRQMEGIFDVVENLLPSLIKVGGDVGSALIQVKGMTEVAETQAKTQLGIAAINERIAQLNLSALTQSSASQYQGASILGGMGESTVGGIPILYIILGGAGLLGLMFVMKR